MIKRIASKPFWRSIFPEVRFRHLRYFVSPEGASEQVEPFGGMTIAYHYLPDTKVLVVAHAMCCDKDKYCKETGRKQAASRLLSSNQHRLYFGIEKLDIKDKLRYDTELELEVWNSKRKLSANTPGYRSFP